MEIDLKKTPLSEIDLSRIDYEKSYVMFKGNKYLIIENTLKQSSYEHDFVLYSLDSKPWRGFLFYPDGKHYYNEATLHLFYKEERECKTCEHAYNPFAVIRHCGNCSGYSKWMPIDDCVENQIEPKAKNPIIIEYQDLGSSVKIVKIEGVMTCNEIKKHAGVKIYDEYVQNSPCIAISDFDGVMYYLFSTNPLQTIKSGQVILKEQFEILIETMKLSAKRLAQLIKDSKEPKIERIVI